MKQISRINYTVSQKTLMKDRRQKGGSMRSIARLFDRSHPSNQRNGGWRIRCAPMIPVVCPGVRRAILAGLLLPPQAQDGCRPPLHQVIRRGLPDHSCGRSPARLQIWRPVLCVVGIRGQHRHPAALQHFDGPLLRQPTEIARHGAGSYLQQAARLKEGQ